jgi:hypothetical protein
MFIFKANSTIVFLVVPNDIHREDFLVIHPNSGFQFFLVSLDSLKKFRKISPDDAKSMWIDCYQSSINCSHVQLYEEF